VVGGAVGELEVVQESLKVIFWANIFYLKTHRKNFLWHRTQGGRAAQSHPVTLLWRLLESCFHLADWLFFPKFLMFLNQIFKPNTRPLTEREIALARSIFGETIDYQKVRLDERSHIGCRQYHFAYVGFYFVNSWGKLSDPVLIHELVHVWQYQRLGSVYIPRALWAQRTPEGYDYGGISSLKKALEQGKTLTDFNYEQQADIVADYFCLKNGWKPRWCKLDKSYLPVFEKILTPILHHHLTSS